MTTTLEVKNISTGYGSFLIYDVNLTLNSGTIFGLAGRSGVGKSTLIKSILGIKKPVKGTVKAYTDGNPIEIHKIIGYAPQDNSLYPYLTLKENIYTFGELLGIKKNVIEKRMKYLLQKLFLSDSEDKKIAQLSGGMRKRADLAVSLIHDPEILVLDEPFAGLDPPLQRFIMNFLMEFARSGKIVILASHVLTQVTRSCSIIGILTGGILKLIPGSTNPLSIEKMLGESYENNSTH